MSRRVAKKIPYFAYTESQYFQTDGAPEEVASKRKQGFIALLDQMKEQCPKTLTYSKSIEDSVSDVRFTSHYRIPFPFRSDLSKELSLGSVADETRGNKIKDLDGNWRYDLSGSYGVNVFGYDFYKECMEVGFQRVSELGPVLGAYHPLIAENIGAIKEVSGLDEISFHMSGTEAVMQAVRLARYHTGRTHLVRLCGAYHGWWDGVQPGIGNNRKTHDVYTLSDMSENTLHVLNTRQDIACVLINPLQAFHPNSDSASDTTLIASERSTNFNKSDYSNWLAKIREICTKRDIVLIFDEVFTGFRLSSRGAQGFFGVDADMVTYGKTLGGGLPVGVLAGTHRLMKRFKDKQPVDVSFARGTFNSHPYVIGAMNEFLRRITTPEIQNLYEGAEALWNKRVTHFNVRLSDEELPVRISNMHSILSVIYTRPSRYNWMLQFYLRACGLELAWTGTGRFIMTLSYTDEEFDDVIDCFITAAKQMEADGWWWSSPALSNKSIKQQFLGDLLSARLPALASLMPSPLHNNRIELDVDTAQRQLQTQENHVKKVG